MDRRKRKRSSKLQCIEQEEAKHQIEEVGQRLRAMMPFMNEGAKTKEEEVVGSAKN